MTTNRAHKRAARAAAEAQNIRYPDALPQTDHKAEPRVQAANQDFDPADMQRVRIVFARRYADLLSAGLEDKQALDLLAASLSAIPGVAAETLAAAIPGVREALGSGSPQGVSWAPCKDLVGGHLFHMLQITDGMGAAPVVLRAAAETLESELRLGVF